jgi:hypothetical protein
MPISGEYRKKGLGVKKTRNFLCRRGEILIMFAPHKSGVSSRTAAQIQVARNPKQQRKGNLGGLRWRFAVVVEPKSLTEQRFVHPAGNQLAQRQEQGPRLR